MVAPSRTANPASGGTASRKQILALMLRETLIRGGLPADALGIEFFRTVDRAGTRNDGIHVRLLVRDGHPGLPARMPALERDFRRRVAFIDERAGEWLQGVSWQFELLQEELAPGARGERPPAMRPREAFHAQTFSSTEPAPL